MKSGKTPPPTPKIGAIPPLPTKGDADIRTTFEFVGRAVSQWEHFEAYLGLVFGHIVGAGDPTEPALRAYGTILTYRGRADMLDAAAKAHFLINPDTDLARTLGTLLKHAKEFSARRNEIAHGIVQPYWPTVEKQDGYAVLPSYHATHKRPLAAKVIGTPERSVGYAYTSVELDVFCKEFGALQKTALEIATALSAVMHA